MGGIASVKVATVNQELKQHYLDNAITTLRAYKKLAEKALDQLRDEEYFTKLDEESNSIAVIMKHLAGNMLFNKYLEQNPDKAEHRFDVAAKFNDEARKDN